MRSRIWFHKRIIIIKKIKKAKRSWKSNQEEEIKHAIGPRFPSKEERKQQQQQLDFKLHLALKIKKKKNQLGVKIM